MARFDREQALRQELAQARSELQAQAQELPATLAELNDRRTIECAKVLLMQRQKLSQQDEYARRRKAAMDRGIKLADIAHRTLDADRLPGSNYASHNCSARLQLRVDCAAGSANIRDSAI